MLILYICPMMLKKISLSTTGMLACMGVYAAEKTVDDLTEEQYYFLQYGNDLSDYTQTKNFVALVVQSEVDKHFYDTGDLEKLLEKFFTNKESVKGKMTHSYGFSQDESSSDQLCLI